MSWLDRLFRRRGAPLPEPRPGAGLSYLLPPAEPDAAPIRGREEQLASYVGWVYAAVSLIAQDVRAAEWTLWRRAGRDRSQWEAVEDHPVLRVLLRPNALMTWGDLLEYTQLALDLAGEAFWHLITDGNRAVGIQYLAPHWVLEPVLQDGRLRSWRVQIPGWGQIREVPAEDMIWLRYPHPLDPWRGASPVEAFAATHHFDLYLRAYGASLMRNDGGVPAGVLSVEHELTQEEADLLRERWMDRYYRKRDGIAVLGKGARYQPIAIPLSDIKFLEIGRFTRDQILGIYRVPASKLGLVDDVNRANAEANDRTYRANALRPRLRRLEEAINTRVLPRLAGQGARALYLEFTDPVEEDPELELRRLEVGLARGVITPNEYRDRIGLDPIPGVGDRLYMPLNTAPVSTTPSEERAVEVRAAQGPEDREKDLELAALRWLAKQDPLEREAKSRVRALLSKEQRLVVQAFRQAYEARAVERREWMDDPLRRTEEEWRTLLQTLWLRAMEDGWELALGETKVPIAWSVYEPLAREYAARMAALKVGQIQGTTREAIREVIARAIEEGWSVDRTARALAELYDGFKGPRAETIARTETAQAVNRGKFAHATEVQRRLGARVVRRWSAILDTRVRPSHAIAHGQEVELGQPYLVGGAHLLHPGDPAGPAGEVINCRCTEVYEVRGE